MPAQDDYEKFKSIAEELALEGDDHENFVNSAMKRKGYKPSLVWQDPEPEENAEEGEGDFFSNRKKQKEAKKEQQQQTPKPDGEGKQASGWQY